MSGGGRGKQLCVKCDNIVTYLGGGGVRDLETGFGWDD
jgi:hypothetical protein